jgi:hypothetical protein
MNQIKRRPNPLETQEKPSETIYEKPVKEFQPKTPVFETRDPILEQRIMNPSSAAANNRDKYTSTMDPALRKRIKIACAMRGIMFAQFVEDACREKLTKEGMM